MKSILIVGCCGCIGRTLVKNIKDEYNIIGCDIAEDNGMISDYYQCNAGDYDQLEKIFRENRIDAVINLTGLAEAEKIPAVDMYDSMVKAYLNSTFYLLTLMKEYSVNKMILASTNHVTDYYEENGYSTLGREIKISDYPISKSIYGSLKLAAENFCKSFYLNYGITSVSFRIGTFREEYDKDCFIDRWNRTMLKTEDLVLFFKKAIENECKADVYFLVSENPDKPWDTEDLKLL